MKPPFTFLGTGGFSWQDPGILIPAPAEYLVTLRVYATSPVDGFIQCRLVKDGDVGIGFAAFDEPLVANTPGVGVVEAVQILNSQVKVECAAPAGVTMSVSKLELLAKRLP